MKLRAAPKQIDGGQRPPWAVIIRTPRASHRSGAMQGLAVVRKSEDAVRGSLAARKDECMRIRQAARAALEENRRRRRAMAEEVRQQLRSYRERILGSLSSTNASVSSAPDQADITASTAVPMVAPERAAFAVSAVVVPEPPTDLEAWGPNAPETAQNADPRLDAADVLGVIKAHREGIALAQIGNELGVDWRLLIGIVRRLLDNGKIEQIQHIYYPVAE